MKKTLVAVIIVAIVAGGGAFYGGMKYAQSKAPQGFMQRDFQNLRNLSPEERQQRLQELGANAGGFRGGFAGDRGEGFVAGEIIAKDDKSITVKLPDGGSKIVFFSESTEIIKSVSGSVGDLKEGSEVSINGEKNSDGSYTAKMIRLGPLGAPQ